MLTYSSSGEVYGTKVLTAAIIVTAVAVLLGSLTAPGIGQSQTQVAAKPAPAEQVVVTAPATHAS